MKVVLLRPYLNLHRKIDIRFWGLLILFTRSLKWYVKKSSNGLQASCIRCSVRQVLYSVYTSWLCFLQVYYMSNSNKVLHSIGVYVEKRCWSKWVLSKSKLIFRSSDLEIPYNDTFNIHFSRHATYLLPCNLSRHTYEDRCRCTSMSSFVQIIFIHHELIN